MSYRSKIWHWYFATVAMIGIAAGTGLIPALGKWYSPSLPFRRQTEAMLHGHVALSFSPPATEHDMVWANGAVQQIWGLGVPVWRLPFEVLARLCGQRAFPDRIALVIAWALVIYLLLRTFLNPGETGLTEIEFVKRHPERVAIVLLLALFPPILTLCRGPFQVYEEVILYGYLYSVSLLAGLLTFAREPRWRLYVVICGLSGLAGSIRPTIACYGVTTVMLAFIYSRKAGWRWTKSIAGLGLFLIGGGLLFRANRERFGAGFEFGQHLNLTYPDLIYTSRFHAPFDKEPWWSAARELFGGLFWVKQTSDIDPYASGIVAFQSATPRWRQFYETTFDFTYLALLLLCWGIFLSRLICRRRQKQPESVLENCSSRRKEAPIHAQRPENLSLVTSAATMTGIFQTRSEMGKREFAVCAIWSLTSLVPLFGFYLHFNALACRYLMDFAPGMAAAMAATVIAMGGDSRGRLWVRWFVSGAVGIWWIWEATSARMIQAIPAVTQTQVLSGMRHEPAGATSLPDKYVIGNSPSQITGIPLNGRGWDTSDGRTGAVVVLFVNEPSRLILKVAPVEEHGTPARPQEALQNALTPSLSHPMGGGARRAGEGFRVGYPTDGPVTEAYSDIQAKIGLEFLNLESLKQTDEGVVLTFSSPKQSAHRKGIQVVFLAFGSPDNFMKKESDFRLLEVKCVADGPRKLSKVFGGRSIRKFPDARR